MPPFSQGLTGDLQTVVTALQAMTVKIGALIDQIAQSAPGASSGFLLLSGGTMTGPLIMTPGSGVNGAAATARSFIGETSGSLRWQIDLGDATPEGGSNAGSDFDILSFSDSGAALATPLKIKRSNSQLTIVVPTNAADDTAASSAGVPIGGIYRNGSALMVRVA
jgi:hypothetical protein